MNNFFKSRTSVEQVEESCDFAPKFDQSGFIVVVTTDYDSGEVLMQGVMNQEALKKTIETGEAYYFSRSRQVLWHKGATSGLIQTVREIRIDDDQDSIWLRVNVVGQASCHVGYRSCFYRKINFSSLQDDSPTLEFVEEKKIFDPKSIYGDAPNPTLL